MESAALPMLEDVRRAAARLAGRIERTPLVPWPTGEEEPRIWLKLENRQLTRSFKARGAQNRALRALEEEEPPSGLATYSSGNHGQAVALAAERLSLPCLVVAPVDVRDTKRAAMEARGAEVLLHGRTSAEREQRCLALAGERGLLVVPPYDHPDIIAGQGTAGLELHEQAGELSLLVSPIGGGGLLSGLSVALGELRPELALWGVEPMDADDARRSLAAGSLQRNEQPSTSACDGLRNTSLGDWNWRVLSQSLSGIATVPDEEVLDTAARLEAAGLGPVEPSGAIALAAVLHGRLPLPDGPIACIVSGGNG